MSDDDECIDECDEESNIDSYEESNIDPDDCYDVDQVGVGVESEKAPVVEATIVQRQSTLSFVKSKFGMPKLTDEGYIYTLERTREEDGDTVYFWRCERICKPDKSQRCYGRCTTTNLVTPISITSDHNHEPDPERVSAMEVADMAMHLARTTDTNPRKV
jgi:hypothetical protein